MTKGPHYKRGKLHHSPWHSDSCTSNWFNTHPHTAITSVSKKNRKPMWIGANETLWISSKQACPINFLHDGIPNGIYSSDRISVTTSEFTKVISVATCHSNCKVISEANSNHSHCGTLLQAGGLWQPRCEAVGKHCSSRYIAQVDLSISSHNCSKIVVGCKVGNCSSTVGSDLDAHN